MADTADYAERFAAAVNGLRSRPGSLAETLASLLAAYTEANETVRPGGGCAAFAAPGFGSGAPAARARLAAAMPTQPVLLEPSLCAVASTRVSDDALPLALAISKFGAVSGPVKEHGLLTRADNPAHHLALLCAGSPATLDVFLSSRYTQIGVACLPAEDPADPTALSVHVILAAEFDAGKDGSATAELTYTPADPCPVCDVPLGTDPVIKAESSFFHVACFVCSVCSVSLAGSGYYLYPDVGDAAYDDPDGPSPAFYCAEHMAVASAVRREYEDRKAEAERAAAAEAARREAEAAERVRRQGARARRASRGRESMRKRSEALEITAASARDLAEQSAAAAAAMAALRLVAPPTMPTVLIDESGANTPDTNAPPARLTDAQQKEAVKVRGAYKRQAALAKTVALHEPDEAKARSLIDGGAAVEKAYPGIDPAKVYPAPELGSVLDQLQTAGLGVMGPDAAASGRLRIAMADTQACVCGPDADADIDGPLASVHSVVRCVREAADKGRGMLGARETEVELDGALAALCTLDDDFDASVRKEAAAPSPSREVVRRGLTGLRRAAGTKADHINALLMCEVAEVARANIPTVPVAVRDMFGAARISDMAAFVPCAKALRDTSKVVIDNAEVIAPRVIDPMLTYEFQIAAKSLGNNTLTAVEAGVDVAKDTEDADAKARLGEAVKGIKQDLADLKAALDKIPRFGNTPAEREARGLGLLDAIVSAVMAGDPPLASALAAKATDVYTLVADDADSVGDVARAAQIRNALPGFTEMATADAGVGAVSDPLAAKIAALRGAADAERAARIAGLAAVDTAKAGGDPTGQLALLRACLQEQLDAARLGADAPGLSPMDLEALLSAAGRLETALAGLTEAMTPPDGVSLADAVDAAVSEALAASASLGLVMDSNSAAAVLASHLAHEAEAALVCAQNAAHSAAADRALGETERANGLHAQLARLIGGCAPATSRPADAVVAQQLLDGQKSVMERAARAAVSGNGDPSVIDAVVAAAKEMGALAAGIAAGTLSPFGLVNAYAALSKHLMDALNQAVGRGDAAAADELSLQIERVHTALARVGHEAADMVADAESAAAAHSHFDNLAGATTTLLHLAKAGDSPGVLTGVQLAKAEIAAAQAALAGRLAPQTEAAVLVAQGKKTRALLKGAVGRGDSESAGILMDQSEAQSLRLVAVGRGIADDADEERVRFVIGEATELQGQQGVLRDVKDAALEDAGNQGELDEAVARADALSDNILAALSGAAMDTLTPVAPLEQPESEADEPIGDGDDELLEEEASVEACAGRSIHVAAKAVSHATAKWDADGNRMVGLASQVADLLAEMSAAMRARDKARLVAAANKILALAEELATAASALADQTPDRILQGDLRILTETLPSISTQLRMMVKVRMSFDGAESDPDALDIVVDCATSLSRSVVSVLSASESAVVSMLAAGIPVPDDLRWHRRRQRRH